MWRMICSMTVVALFTATSMMWAEDPKFAQLKTKSLITATAPDLKGGVVFGGGALDLSANPAAMILAEFTSPARAGFVHVKMIYKGEYTDPNTKIPGYLYHLKDKSYDRYFFVSTTGIQGANDSHRYVIDYDDSGNPLAYFHGNFAPRP
jgi:hypothetical protein